MEPILTTKLHIPAAHPNRISRSHLLQKLDEDLWQARGERFLRRLTLIAAPAGYGKSTLLCEWVRHLDIPVAWVSFDEADNDPGRFLQYFIAALQTVQPEIGTTYLSLLQSQPSAVTGEVASSVMAGLVNEIAAAPQPLFLVFDDYHTLQAREIQRVVKLFLDHLPENLSLVIATRSDPPLPLARLRARRLMLEVRANDLRFSEKEASTFLRQVMQLNLPDPEIQTLMAHTEGWIAGLQMAALALQGQRDNAHFIRNFSGRERFVIDYLFEEVLSQQPEDIQTFLVQTAILERMSGPLCDAVSRDRETEDQAVQNGSLPAPRSGQQFLEYLERSNLFVVPLDEQREWFRYHHLFTDLLRHHLRSVRSAETIAGLYERASRWCERQALIDEAMHYAALSGNQSQLAKLVEISGRTLVQTGQVAQRARLIRLLSSETLRANPGLCIECAWSEMFARQSPDLRQAEVYLQMAEQGVAEHPGCVDGSGYPVAYRAAHTRAILSRFKGDAPETVIDSTNRALDLLPLEDLYYRCSLHQNLGMAYIAMTNLAEAWKHLEQSWKDARTVGLSYVSITSAYMLSRCLQTQGRLDAMDHLLKTALADLQETRSSLECLIPAQGLLYIARAWLLFERGDSAVTVEQELKQGLELCALTAERFVLVEGYALHARLLAAQGDVAGALSSLEEMVANCPEAAGFGAAYRIRLLLARNSEDSGIELYSARLPSKPDGRVFPVTITSYLWHWEEQMGLVRLQITRKQRSQATDLKPVLHYLDLQIETCQSAGWQMQHIELLLLKALALDANGAMPAAAEALGKALKIAEAHGFYRLLLEEGAPLANLVHRAANMLPDLPLLHRLRSGLDLDENSAPPVKPAQTFPQDHSNADLVDPLTDRELEVLQLMAAGFSNKEIAQKLVLTVGTVKTHASNIYRKLDVLGRTKALAKARRLNLL